MNKPLPVAQTLGASGVSAPSHIQLDDLDDDTPWDALPDPDRFYIIVKPVGLKRKVGSILLTDQTVDDQHWTHGMVRVLKVGPSVYRGKRYEDMGLTPEDAPKVGDIVYISPRQPTRFNIEGKLYLLVADDACLGRINPAEAHKLSFLIG